MRHRACECTSVRQRQPGSLDVWLERAENSHFAPLVRFAQSLREDYDAVKAGVTLSTSNSPVEGQINRLKMLKRQNVWTSRHWFTEPPFLVGKLSDLVW